MCISALANMHQRESAAKSSKQACVICKSHGLMHGSERISCVWMEMFLLCSGCSLD
jgi:prophage maintenance system killer protein